MNNGLISSEQHAYQSQESVTTAWKELETITMDAPDRKKMVSYQMQDMSVAFNLVDRKILVPKMARLGCSKQVCDLIDSYRMGRTNSVKIAGHVSDPVDVSTRVGEGSMLGPFIFLIQIIEVSIVGGGCRTSHHTIC